MTRLHARSRPVWLSESRVRQDCRRWTAKLTPWIPWRRLRRLSRRPPSPHSWAARPTRRDRRSSSTAATPLATISASRLRTRPRPLTASWQRCPAIRGGSGPWCWPRTPGPTAPRSARWCWFRVRQHCWPRSGCPGRSASGPGTSDPVISWLRSPMIRVWYPDTSRPVTRRSTMSPSRSGSAAAGY